MPEAPSRALVPEDPALPSEHGLPPCGSWPRGTRKTPAPVVPSFPGGGLSPRMYLCSVLERKGSQGRGGGMGERSELLRGSGQRTSRVDLAAVLSFQCPG